MSNTNSALPSNGNGKRTSRRRRQWGFSKEKRVIDWSHPLFGTVRIDTRRFEIGEVEQIGPNTWAPIILKHNEPATIQLDFAHEVHDDVFVLRTQAGIVTDVTWGGIPSFEVTVEWISDRPHTRQKEKDNFDLIFLKKDGFFVQLEISIVTRNGRFWLCVQEIFGGTFAENGLSDIVALPLYAENNYPGVDYLKMCKEAAPELLEFVAQHCQMIDVIMVGVPAWEPKWAHPLSEPMKKNGWVRAVIKYFNVVIGYGFVLCEDGKTCFVHFSNIVDEFGRPIVSKGEFPLLSPMSGVAVKYKEENGGRKATAVRIV
jgi:cold shock CspA family protein